MYEGQSQAQTEGPIPEAVAESQAKASSTPALPTHWRELRQGGKPNRSRSRSSTVTLHYTLATHESGLVAEMEGELAW